MIQILGERMLRFRYAPRGHFERDFSYAIDPGFEADQVNFKLTEESVYYELKTAFLVCRIRKDNLAIQLLNKEGQIINEDKDGYLAKASINNGLTNVSLKKNNTGGRILFWVGR